MLCAMLVCFFSNVSVLLFNNSALPSDNCIIFYIYNNEIMTSAYFSQDYNK